ncbi:MAG: hypothetical protein LBI12_02560, partial [Treponema sp.]|nr:hypothetical protein [Treponema sp.]
MAKKNQTASTVQESLAKELKSLISQLDSEGLAFLVQQAKVHIYNMKADELNKAAEDIRSAPVNSGIISGKAKKSKAENSPKETKFSIDTTSAGFYMRFNNGGTM